MFIIMLKKIFLSFKKGNNDKDNGNNDNSLLIGLFVVIPLIFCIIGIFLFLKYSKKGNY